VQQVGDLAGVRANHQHEDERGDHEAGAGEPQRRERVAVELLARQQRAEHGRAEDRAEDRAEEDERDAVRPALGRVHVARGGTRQQRGSARRADAEEAQQHERREVGGAADRGEHPAERTHREARREHRHAADAVHRPAGPGRDERA
jgi:hypothetical protein